MNKNIIVYKYTKFILQTWKDIIKQISNQNP